MSQVLPVSCPE